MSKLFAGSWNCYVPMDIETLARLKEFFERLIYSKDLFYEYDLNKANLILFLWKFEFF